MLVAVDIALFTVHSGRLQILLVGKATAHFHRRRPQQIDLLQHRRQ